MYGMILAGAIVGLSLGLGQASAAIPYPAALSGAAVLEDNLSGISQRGLVLGNGELNVIVYAGKDNTLRLRISKNDCWDVRVDTAEDPPLPIIDVATGKVIGHGDSASWKKPYPTALPPVELVLGTAGQAPLSSARLDLDRAAATIQVGGEAVEARVLAQSNVILLRSKQSLSMLGILEFLKGKNLDSWISKSQVGEQDGHAYLHQNIPGDADVSGMDIYVVAGRKADLQAIAVVTSREWADPLAEASRLVTSTLDDSGAVAKHESVWREYWAKSGIELGDAELQNWWYRMVYFNRVLSRSGGNAVGLAGCYERLAGWHNSLKLNYNIQQTYLASAPQNHPELIEPFIDVLLKGLPRAEWFAKTSFPGCEGAFYHSDLWPFEPDPDKCTTNCKHQQAYLPYGYSWGMDGQTAVVVWEYYTFAPTPAHLDRIYPLIKDFGLFYCSILEKCALVNGKRRMGPSFFPELGKYDEYDVCYDIHFVTAGLRIAREAATLKHDTALLARIAAVIDQVPTYAPIADPKQDGQTVINRYDGSPLDHGSDRHGTAVQGIFPAGIINWFSPQDLKDLGKRTINLVERSTTHANSNVTINIARARLGLGEEAIANAKLCFSGTTGKYSKEQPNGFFFWNGHGYFITEQLCVARLVSELLLQSVGNVLRIFPAWPKETDAQFTNLLAEGGFEVSAEQKAGKVTNLWVHSTVGGTLRLLSPWLGKPVVTAGPQAKAVEVKVENGVSSFDTEVEQTYQLRPPDGA